MYQRDSVLDVEVFLTCHGWRTRLLPGKRALRPKTNLGLGICRLQTFFGCLCEHIDSRFDQQEKKLDEIMKMKIGTSRRKESLEHDARQPRLAMEADGPADTKICERTEGAATTV